MLRNLFKTIQASEQVKKQLKVCRETIETVVLQKIPHWEDEMRRRGFRRLYDKNGNNFWVSSWYSERCESILDEDGKRMYWTRDGWEIEVGSKSPRGSSINAIRKLKG